MWPRTNFKNSDLITLSACTIHIFLGGRDRHPFFFVRLCFPVLIPLFLLVFHSADFHHPTLCCRLLCLGGILWIRDRDFDMETPLLCILYHTPLHVCSFPTDFHPAKINSDIPRVIPSLPHSESSYLPVHVFLLQHQRLPLFLAPHLSPSPENRSERRLVENAPGHRSMLRLALALHTLQCRQQTTHKLQPLQHICKINLKVCRLQHETCPLEHLTGSNFGIASLKTSLTTSMIHVNLLSVPHQTSATSILHFISIPAAVMEAWIRGDSSQAPRPTDISCFLPVTKLLSPVTFSNSLEPSLHKYHRSFSFCVNAREFRCFGELHNPAVAFRHDCCFFSFTHPIQNASEFFNRLKTTRNVHCVRTPILPSRAQRWLVQNIHIHIHPNQCPVKCHHAQVTAGHPFFLVQHFSFFTMPSKNI